MVWSAARGGMRSVVETYRDDGFLDSEDVTLVASYVDGGFLKRQAVLLGALARFTWLVSTNRVTLMHCHSAMRGSFWRKSLFARLARLRDIPVLFHLHGSEMKLFYERQSPRLQRLIAQELSAADRVLVLSESWRAFVAGIAPAARPVVIPNYVRIPPPVTRTQQGDIRILFLGLVGPRKGTFDLLEALSIALRTRPDLKLLVGGNGQVAEAKALAAQLEIEDRVEFLGWIDGAKKQDLLATADIFTLPSHNEGLPMSVLEAMAYALPVITTPVGGIPELVTDGVDGLLVTPGDRDALAQALVNLAVDPALRGRLGQAGRERVVANYSSEVVLGRLKDLYRTVAKPDAPAKRSQAATAS